MQREQTRDIDFGGQRYRLGKLPVGLASWVLVKVMGVVMASSSEDGDGSKEPNHLARFLGAFSRLTQEDFLEIQTQILMHVCRYEQTKSGDVPMPIMKAPGVFAYQDLQYDIKTIMALTMQGVEFNVAPFFADVNESK